MADKKQLAMSECSNDQVVEEATAAEHNPEDEEVINLEEEF